MANTKAPRGRPPVHARIAREAAIDTAEQAALPPPPVEEDVIVTTRPVEVAPSRPPMRVMDSRERAAQRAAEIRENRDASYDGNDRFHIDRSTIPDGFDYEWKTKFVANQEDIGRMISYRKSGWEEVPRERHPEMMPLGSREQFILREGMVLMERPLEITEEVRRREQHEARSRVTGHEEKIRGTADELSVGDGPRSSRIASKVGKSYEAGEIRKTNYSYDA